MITRKKLLTSLAFLAMSAIPYAAFGASSAPTATATSGLSETKAILAQLQDQTEKNANAYASAAAVEPPAYIKNGTPAPSTVIISDSSTPNSAEPATINISAPSTDSARENSTVRTIVVSVSPTTGAPRTFKRVTTTATNSSVDESADNDGEGFSQIIPVVKETAQPNHPLVATPAAKEEIVQELVPEFIKPYAELVPSTTVSAWTSEYNKNPLQSFELTLNQKAYAFTIPAKNLGYNVSSSSSYNRTNGVIANTFTTKVVSEAIVNDRPLRIIIELKQPIGEIDQLKNLHNASTIDVNKLARIFAYNESVDGVKAAPHYSYYNTTSNFIPLKSGYVSAPNGDNRPFSMAMIALNDTTLATVTVSSNKSDDYNLVKGTAYNIAHSVVAK